MLMLSGDSRVIRKLIDEFAREDTRVGDPVHTSDREYGMFQVVRLGMFSKHLEKIHSSVLRLHGRLLSLHRSGVVGAVTMYLLDDTSSARLKYTAIPSAPAPLTKHANALLEIPQDTNCFIRTLEEVVTRVAPRYEKPPVKNIRRAQKRLQRSMRRCDQRRGTPPNGAPSMHRTVRVRRHGH